MSFTPYGPDPDEPDEPDERLTAEERAKAILDELSIQLAVGGCGCCSSPWITLVYQGETILDTEGFNFSNLKEG
jgi:hypothetical protein